jgi:hypothetical protein
MKLRFSKKEINRLAKEYERKYPAEVEKETKLINLRHEVRSAGHLTREQVKKVAEWKATRAAGHVDKNSEEYVREITALAFSAKEERSRIGILTLLDGVGWPMASVILHFFHRDPYPILDFRALESVEAKQPKQYTFPFWWSYVEFCRALAQRNAVDMRTLDRALWWHSKKQEEPVPRVAGAPAYELEVR